MLDKTTKTTITSQPTVASKSQPIHGNGVAHRASTQSAVASDKTVAGLELACDHQAPISRVPSLEGIQAPEPPRKVKSESLSASQRAVLGKAFKDMKNARQAGRSLHVSSIEPGKPTPIKEPSVLEFVGSNGEKQRWVISPTQRRGSYGKFRIAVLDAPAGKPPAVTAIKEYRLDGRRDRSDVLKPSYDQRIDAIEALENIVYTHPALAIHARSLKLDLKNPLKALSRKAYDKMVNYIQNKADAMGRPLSEEIGDRLQLRKSQTHAIAEEDIAAENALYPLANSPLRVQESVEHDGRVSNFSELMRGELFDVATSKSLSKLDRVVLARSTARDLNARLSELHDAGIVHLDIKLENVFVDSDGKPQLGDWGFATLLQDGKTTGIKGTMDYIAPEVLAGHPYGKAADIYSLGHTIAAASLNELLLDMSCTYYFKQNKKTFSTQHEALSLAIEQLTFDKRGAIESPSLDALQRHFIALLPPFEEAKARMLTKQALAQIIPRIVRWNKIDPLLCGTVLKHMLRGDPASRRDTKALQPLLSALQPENTLGVPHVRSIAKRILAESIDLDAEVAVLQAYAKAYNSEE